MYADDALYIIVGKTRWRNQDKIDDNFCRIKDYLNSHGLQINEAKTTLTEYMSSQKRAKLIGIPPELTVAKLIGDKYHNKHVTDSVYSRILGINVKNNLSWESHLLGGKKAILPSVRRQIGALHHIKNMMTKKARLQVVNALIMSRLVYLINIWGNTTSNLIQKAQIVQNVAARMVTGHKRTTRQKTLLKDCNWLNMEDLTEYHSLVMFWKTLKWGRPASQRETPG